MTESELFSLGVVSPHLPGEILRAVLVKFGQFFPSFSVSFSQFKSFSLIFSQFQSVLVNFCQL